MADDSPTHRISQIFNSLSGLSEIQRQQDQLLKRTKHNNFPTTGDTISVCDSSNASSSTSPSSSAAAPLVLSTSSLPYVSISPNTSLPTTASACRTNASLMATRSTPNSPRLMPKRQRAPPAVPTSLIPNAAHFANPALVSLENMTTGSASDAPQLPASSVHGGSWPHLSALTEHLDVRQVNNYAQAAMPEINWQERCLELQLELHRSKNQSGRIRDMLREKVSAEKTFLNIYVFTISQQIANVLLIFNDPWY